MCPEGYFGDHCMTPCECKNDNSVCHAVEGCICRHGYTGENCDVTLYASSTQRHNNGGGYGSIVAGVMLAVIFVAVIVALMFYYRRRVANLKTEIAHVQYIADAQSLSPGKHLLTALLTAFGKQKHLHHRSSRSLVLDRNHFDNPVYSYQGGGRREDDIGLLNNTNHIRNNLVKQNNATLEKKRLGVPCSSGDDDSCKGKCSLPLSF